MPATCAKCQNCGRCFRRLDTHHRVSATCRNVPQRSAPPTMIMTPPPMNILSPPSFVNSNYAEMLQHSTCTASAVATFRHPVTHQRVLSPATKATLCLPTSAEDRKLADSFFQTTLVPEFMFLTSPEHMSSVLCEASTPTSPPHSAPRPPPSGE